MFRAAQAKGPSTSAGTGGSGGSGNVDGSFTTGTLPVGAGLHTLSDSIVAQAAGVITITGGLKVTDLAGTGSRMVVVDAAGLTSTQAIPTGSVANPTATIGLTAVNGSASSSIRSDGAPALSQTIVPTWTGVHTFSAQPIFSSLTASLPVFTDASKGLVSNAMTGTGSVVMSASPTLTGTVTAAAATLSSTLLVSGVATFTLAPVLSALTASLPVFTNGSKALVSNTMTGTGDVVMSASPTLTGTISAAALTLSGNLLLSALTASQAVFTNGSKVLVSNALTGTGNVVMSASPTLTGTLTAAAADFSTNVTVSGTLLVAGVLTNNQLTGTGTRLVTVTAAGGLSAATTIAGNYTWSGTAAFSSTLGVTGVVTLANLAGSGTRMVVADASGVLSTQSIPAGGSLADPTGTIGLTAVNGVLTTGMRSDGAPALSQAIVPTWTGVHTFSAQPIFSTLTASLPVFTDGSKGLVSNAMTGTGNVVMSASPTLTGTLTAATATFSGIVTLTSQPILSSLTASLPVFTDASKGLVSNAMTGTGNVVMSASPTLTGTLIAAAVTLSSTLTLSALTASLPVFTDASKGLVSNAMTGTGNVVMSASPTLTGTITAAALTLSGNLTLSALTASQAVFTNGSKVLVSNAITGTGSVVMSASPTLTGTVTAAAATFSSTVGVTGVVTLTDLAGSGTRMVVADASGVLSTQSIPSGSSLANPTGTIGLTAVNGVLTSGMRSDGAPALSQAIVPTWTGVHTFSAQPILSTLTASLPVFTDGSKGLVSNAMTGTGNVVMSASPTLTGTIIAAAATLSGVLTVNSTLTVNTDLGTPGSWGLSVVTSSGGDGIQSLDNIRDHVSNVFRVRMRTGGTPITALSIDGLGAVTLPVSLSITGLTASRAVFTDGSKILVSNALTGTGNVVMSASPTLTGTITAAAATLSGVLTLSNVTASTILAVNASNAVISATSTGTGNVVLSASPTFTGTIIAAAATLSGVVTLSGLTASQAVFTDGSKALVSNAITGTGNVVMSASPTLSGTVAAANGTFSGTLGVTGVATFTAAPVFSALTASQAVFTDGSKALVSNSVTGSGNVVMSASPTLTGTITAAAANLSSTLTASGLTTINNTLTVNSDSGTPGFWGLSIITSMAGDGTQSLDNIRDVITNVFQIRMRTAGTPVVGLSIAGSGIVTHPNGTIDSTLTASQAVFTNGSNQLVSNAITGTGNVVMSASPTLTGTITAAAATLSGVLTLNATGTGAASALLIAAAQPTITFRESDAGTNLKVWDITANGNVLSFRALQDDYSGATTFFDFTRNSSGSVTDVTFRTGATAVSSSRFIFVDGSYKMTGVSDTGTGSVVRAGSPALTGTATAVNLTVTGTLTLNTEWTGVLGVTAGVVGQLSTTGTGSTVAMSASPTFTGTVTVAALTATGLLTHAATLSSAVALSQSGAAIATDASLADDFTISAGGGTGGGDYAMSNPTNPTVGRTIRYRIAWETGYPTSWGSAFGFITDENPSGTIPASTGASHKKLYIAFRYNVDSKWDCLGYTFARNF